MRYQSMWFHLTSIQLHLTTNVFPLLIQCHLTTNPFSFDSWFGVDIYIDTVFWNNGESNPTHCCSIRPKLLCAIQNEFPVNVTPLDYPSNYQYNFMWHPIWPYVCNYFLFASCHPHFLFSPFPLHIPLLAVALNIWFAFLCTTTRRLADTL